MTRQAVGEQRGSVLRRDGVVITAFLALTALMTNPLVLHITDAVEDKQDGLLNTWIIAWVGHALVTDPLRLLDTNIFFPFAKTLAFSEVLVPQGLLALPINLSSGNTILGYNLVLLFSFFLAAYAMYLLVYNWTRSRGAAFVAGLIFAYNPYFLGNLSQIQLLSFGWMPLVLLFLPRLMEAKTDGSKEVRSGVKASTVFALFFSLQALSSIYYAMLAACAVTVYGVWILLKHRENLLPYRAIAGRLTLSALIIAIFTVPMLLPYLDVQRELGFARNLEESEPFSASAKLYAEVAPQNILYGGLLAPNPPITNGCYPLDSLFPGLVAVGLAIIGLLAHRGAKWFAFILLALALVLSLGPRLHLTPTLPTDITLPYRWLYDLIPLMHAFRAPVRFAALVMLALAVLAGLGVERIRDGRLRVLGLGTAILPVALGAGITFEYLNLPAANIAPVPTGSSIPEYVRWLAAQPHGLALELPMIEPACPLDLTAQYLSTYHWQDTPDGYSGFNPKPRGGIAYEMESFPSERALSLLQALGVNYVIVHNDKLPQVRAAAAQVRELTLIQQSGDELVYQVSQREQQWSDVNGRIYLPQPAAPGQTYTAYLVLHNSAARSIAVTPDRTMQVHWQYNSLAEQPRQSESGQMTVSVPLVTSSASVVPIRLTAPSQPGDYHALLSVRPDNVTVWNLESDVRVGNEEAASEVVLPASVTLAQPLKSSYAPGDRVAVQLDWHALNKIDQYYSASIRIVDSMGEKLVAQDREPVVHTMLWKPGSTIRDQFELTLPQDVVKGRVSLQVMMYHAELGMDALLLDKDFVPRKSIELGTFEVK